MKKVIMCCMYNINNSDMIVILFGLVFVVGLWFYGILSYSDHPPPKKYLKRNFLL